MKNKQNRVAIVTGGTSNIGLEIVKLFIKKGINVAYVGSSIKSIKETSKVLKNNNLTNGAHGFSCDISNVKNINRLVNDIVKTFGKIDIIVNSAGVLDNSDIECTTEKIWSNVMSVNLNAPFFIIQKALPYLKKSKSPRIVNISSNAGRMGGYANGMSYSASKGGLIAMTYGLSRKLAKYKITVNCVAPGTIESDMLYERSPEIQKKLLDKFPLGRFGKSSEVAEAVYYFVDEKSCFTTGAVLDVNGGLFTG